MNTAYALRLTRAAVSVALYLRGDLPRLDEEQAVIVRYATIGQLESAFEVAEAENSFSSSATPPHPILDQQLLRNVKHYCGP